MYDIILASFKRSLNALIQRILSHHLTIISTFIINLSSSSETVYTIKHAIYRNSFYIALQYERRTKKQHLIPAYVLPNASEDLFLYSRKTPAKFCYFFLNSRKTPDMFWSFQEVTFLDSRKTPGCSAVSRFSRKIFLTENYIRAKSFLK